MATMYKVRYKCRRCGRFNTTRAKKDPSAPATCLNCGSSRTQYISHSEVRR